MSEYLSMGGYAAYVWPAWLVWAGVVLGVTIDSRRRLASARRRLELLERAGQVPDRGRT